MRDAHPIWYESTRDSRTPQLEQVWYVGLHEARMPPAPYLVPYMPVLASLNRVSNESEGSVFADVGPRRLRRTSLAGIYILGTKYMDYVAVVFMLDSKLQSSFSQDPKLGHGDGCDAG